MANILDPRPGSMRGGLARRWQMRALAPLALLLTLFGAPTGAAPPLAIQNVTVIDGTDRPAAPNMTVIIEAGRIAAIGPSKKVRTPKGARLLNGAGKFLIPGLWDMHVHGATDSRAPWSQLLFVANGVVGVRDMAGPSDAHAWRASQLGNMDPAPTIYLGSPIVDGPTAVWPDSIVVGDPAQGRAVVDQQQERGADFIKVYSRLSREVYFAIADEAKARGIPFEGHVPETVTAAEASGAGQRSIEHLTQVAEGVSSDESAILAEMQRLEGQFRSPDATMEQKIAAGRGIIQLNAHTVETFDESTARALFELFVKNETWQTPTLTLLQGQIDSPLDENDPRLKYLSKTVRTRWEDGYYKNIPPGPRAAIVGVAKAQFAESMKIVGLMYRAGVPLLAGTDTMNPHCFPGFGIHDELALLVEAGLPPLAAIQTATRNAAQFMGWLGQRGTIEVGKAADLVLLNKNPLTDIHNTRTIESVVLQGTLFTRANLDDLLAKAQARASAQETASP